MTDSEVDSEFERFMEQSVSSALSGEKSVSLDVSSSSQSVTQQSDVSTGGEASISHQEEHLGGDLQSFGQSWLKSSAPFKPNSEKLASPSPIGDRMKENKEESTSYSVERFSKDSLDVSSRSNSVPAMGQDTLEEIADKEKFFRDLETGKQSPVDYAALNDQLTLTGTVVSFKLPNVDQDESDDDGDEESMTPSTVGSTSDVSSNESRQSVREEAGGSSESVESNSKQLSSQSSQGTPSNSEKEEFSDKSQLSSTVSSSSENSATVNPVEKQPTDTSSPPQEGTLVSQRESISHKSSRLATESSLSSSSTISQEDGNFKESLQDKGLSLSKSLDLEGEARGFNLSPIQTSATKVVGESSQNPLEDRPPQKSVLPRDTGISEDVSLLKLNDEVSPVGPPVPGNTSPKVLQQPTVRSASTSVVAKERSFEPSTQVKQPSHVRVSSPSFLFHSNGTLEASLKEVYAEKHSIDKDIEDVQAALEAAGLSGLGEYPKSTAHTEEDIDIQSLLREITKEEVISKSKQILHQRRGKTGPKSTIPGSPLLRTSTSDSLKPVGSTSPQPGSSKKSPAVATSWLPVRARKSVDSTTKGKSTLVLSAVPPGEEVEDSEPVVVKDSPSVGRELKLLEEVSRWREVCEEERNDKRELETKWIAREKEILQREEMLKLQHQKELQEMKSEVFTLSAKLRERDVQSDTRRRLAVGDSVDSIPVEERNRLQRELKEQEKLLEGYQRENEKVCRELSKVQKEFKISKEALSEENQILRAELANERAKQELKVTSRPPTNSVTVPSPDQGRIAVLEDELERAHYEQKKLVSKVSQLEQMVSVYEADVRSVTRERDGLKKNMTSLVAADTVEELKQRHQVEIQSLQEKLKWYGENQELLDRDAAILRQKEEQVRELSLKLERFEEDSRNQKKLVKERATDARRIRDLERQIKEMETIIRRRFPNSITAMIYATSHEEDTQDQKKTHDSPHTSLYLERKVRALEKELEEKDEEHSRRIRALQQQYTAMEISYEAEMKKLKDKLVDFQNLKAASRKETQPHSTVNSLQKELERKKVIYQAKISELQQEVARLKRDGKKLADLTNKETEQKRGVSPQKGLVHGEGATIEALQKELASRKREYQKIRKERDSLWEQVEQFQQQQQKQLEECLQHSDRMTEKHSHDKKQADIVVQENKALKEQLSQLQLTATQERIHLQGQLAQTEAKGRQVREDLEDKIRQLEKNHRDQVNQLVAKHAQEHSNSIVVKMKAQLANQKVQIEHLKEQVESCRFDSEALISCKLREKGLEEKLKAMALDLIEAKRYHSPEMHHYTVILGKITSLENKLNLLQEKREASLQQLSLPSQQALLDVEKKWRMRLLEKDAEIENFRLQIDEILETLSALKPSLALPTHS